jgi:type VI secretion system protein ImpA
MNEMVEKLLQPVSAEQPCGPDLSNEPSFGALETLLKGKPEVEMGAVQRPAEPPDWNELRRQSAAYLAKSKHLRVAVMFCGSLLKTEGTTGFRDGLQFIRGLLEQYWPTLHPQLDPEDNNDPERRLNILRALTLERGAMAAGWLTVVDYLYAAEVCRPKGLPPVIFDQILSARQKATDDSEAAKLEAAIRSAGSDIAAVHYQAFKESLTAVQGIDQFLTTTVGASKAISFEVLENTLNELLGLMGAYLPGGTAELEASTAGRGAQGSTVESATGISVRGPVKSRDDVVRVIDSICEYYQQVEPGSPVPYLLRRAQKIVKMNFVQTVQELNIATADTLRPSMGSAVDMNAPPSQTPAS